MSRRKSRLLGTWQCEYCLEGNAAELKHAIQKGTVVAVSDGSFQCGVRAAVWTIEGTTVDNQIRGARQTPGDEGNQSPYWSKLFGLWGIFASLKCFIDEQAITEGQVVIVRDGLLALQKAHTTLWIQMKHTNLISAI